MSPKDENPIATVALVASGFAVFQLALWLPNDLVAQLAGVIR